MEQEYLPRIVRVDWLRFQFESPSSRMLKTLILILQLPFEKRLQSNPDIRDKTHLALYKVWHEVYEFQGSLLGVNFSPEGVEARHKYFVDLNGQVLSSIQVSVLQTLLCCAQCESEFTANRIDIALDFSLQFPRLSMRNWESFVEDGLLCGFRTVRRISNVGSIKDFTTVYLGSRESTRCVRIYEKKLDGLSYDRIEVEFKRNRAEWIMKQLAFCSIVDFPKFINGVACGEIKFVRYHQDTQFFENYRYGSITVPAPSLHLDIEKSILFIERHCATLAMVEEFMGAEKFDKFIRLQLSAGKLRMKPRHRTILENAKFLGVTALGVFLILVQTSGAVASGLTCPAPVPLSFQVSQKFPIDIVQPTPAEQAYFDNIGDGCFQVNSGLDFQKICLPGMIVNALKPFVIMGLGIKFIFSD